MNKIKVTRVIEITYDSQETFQADHNGWNLPEAGQGNFGPHKAWKQTITVEEIPPLSSPAVQGMGEDR